MTDFILAHVWVFVLAFVLLVLRPLFAYFNPNNLGGGLPHTPAGASR
jgi:hypothetical protein